MKKRLLSIFLIVSIIISVFAVGAVSASATSKAAKPIITTILPINGKLNINWYHNGKQTKLYGIAIQEWYGEWKAYYTDNSSQKYFNITGLKPYKNYNIRICAYDLNGNRSEPSNQKVINWNASINSKKLTCRGRYNYVELNFGNQFCKPDGYYVYYNVAAFTRATNKQGMSVLSKKYVYSTKNNNTMYSYNTHKDLIFATPTTSREKVEIKQSLEGVHRYKRIYQVQAVFLINGKEHCSGWSRPCVVDLSNSLKEYLC